VHAFAAALENLGPYGASLTAAADALQNGPADFAKLAPKSK
jgi:hypothetical protein